MAQEVLGQMPQAVMTNPNGVMAVNYAKLGMRSKVVHQSADPVIISDLPFRS